MTRRRGGKAEDIGGIKLRKPENSEESHIYPDTVHHIIVLLETPRFELRIPVATDERSITLQVKPRRENTEHHI